MLRLSQYRSMHDDSACLVLARNIVHGKVHNAWVLLRRNLVDSKRDCIELDSLSGLRRKVLDARSQEELLGMEGEAGALYFKLFSKLVQRDGSSWFDFNSRNRRPPKDPVNAVLSFLYALLLKDVTRAIWSVGFDPGIGFYHKIRPGRPSLGLDLMEEFRPLIADSVAISLFNKNMLDEKDFVMGSSACALRSYGRKKVIKAYEKRMESMVIHPIFKYSLSYRRAIEIQVRLVAKYIYGEIDRYPAFKTR